MPKALPGYEYWIVLGTGRPGHLLFRKRLVAVLTPSQGQVDNIAYNGIIEVRDTKLNGMDADLVTRTLVSTLFPQQQIVIVTPEINLENLPGYVRSCFTPQEF